VLASSVAMNADPMWARSAPSSRLAHATVHSRTTLATGIATISSPGDQGIALTMVLAETHTPATT
jgi:hypothetical protein